jgi:hypothetical protein
LGEAGIKVWRDRDNIRAGADWRQDIETGIGDSSAIIVALSSNSAESSYVTFEWAYALGYGKNLIPLKLNDCSIHPRLQTIQYLDFSIPGALPWESLIDRIKEVETEAQVESEVPPAQDTVEATEPVNIYVRAILAYMDQRGYQAMSFDAVRKRVDASLTNENLNQLILDHPTLLRLARLMSGKPGLKKIQP